MEFKHLVIFSIPSLPYRALKELILRYIDNYSNLNNGFFEGNFLTGWDQNKYRLNSWAIIMNEGGNLKCHNHETALLSGTFYLQMPADSLNNNEGALLFTHQGPKYPASLIISGENYPTPRQRFKSIPIISFPQNSTIQRRKTTNLRSFDVSRNENV